MTDATEGPHYLTGHLLIAMPNMPDPRFSRAVIYVCAHTDEGAMGFVVNRLFGAIDFPDLLEQLGIDDSFATRDRPVHFGGPVEPARGFVLHSTDFVREGTLLVDDDVAVTATVDILRAISEGNGPRRSLLALGYAGWGPGQLDAEIQANGWLHVMADETLLFNGDIETTWDRAVAKIGVSPLMLSGEAGHA